jgi:hypothetical protein
MTLGSAEIVAIGAAVSTATSLAKKYVSNLKPWGAVFGLSAVFEGAWLYSQPILPTRIDTWAILVGYGAICMVASGVYEATTSAVQGVTKMINGEG